MVHLESTTQDDNRQSPSMTRGRVLAFAIAIALAVIVAGLWAIGMVWPYGFPGPHCPNYIDDSNAAYLADGTVQCLYPGVPGSYPVLLVYDPPTGEWTSNRVEADGSLTLLIEDYRPFDPSASYPESPTP